MNIIFLTANFKPEIAANIHLVSDLVEDLVKMGCKVQVVTSLPRRGVNEKNKT